MAVVDLEEARVALRGDEPQRLLGLRECLWLDAKREPYELKNPVHVEELAKDVAGFANTAIGGLIVLGIGTREEHGSEVLDQLVPFQRSIVHSKQYRDLIRERITPSPRGVSVEWSDCGNGTGVAFIDIPRQPAANFPYVVAAPVGKPGKVNATTVAVPIREADHTTWLPRTEIHRLLHAGWTAAGSPSTHSLAQVLKEAVASAREKPRVAAGDGLGARAGDFKEAYTALGRQVRIGDPLGEGSWDEEGLGAFQYIAPASPSDSGWVLCAVLGQHPVALARPIWDALLDAGGGTITTVGYPGDSRHPSPNRVQLGLNAVAIALDWGSWGPGLLIRRAEHSWIWEPRTRMAPQVLRSSGNWTSNPEPPRLRIRALASLPWGPGAEMKITPFLRSRLLNSGALQPFGDALALLSINRGGSHAFTSSFGKGPNRNDSGAASYLATTTDPRETRPVLSAEALIALPSALEPAVVTCAEVRVDDLCSWKYGRKAVSRGHSLSLGEVMTVLFAAWKTATEVLPWLGVPDARTRRWTSPPEVELSLSTDRAHNDEGSSIALTDVIDFSPFGPTDRRRLTKMSITTTAAPFLSRYERDSLVREAVAEMGMAFGFAQAGINAIGDLTIAPPEPYEPEDQCHGQSQSHDEEPS
ncbi:hypothetical protein [Streptomyces sp. enrichment culture]|uniref:hypothetical protein n=1 Tax=Streptomyces sp. enrichment culture TaxID=1795815 RepID=UPI003F554F0E